MKTQYLALSLILGACGQGAQNLADAINKASAANSSTSTATDTNTAANTKDPSKTPSNVASTTTTTDSTETTTTTHTIHSSVTVTTVNGGAVGVSTNGQQGEGVQGTREQPKSNSVNLTEDNLDKDGCTDFNLTGDFDVSIDIRRGADVKFVAYFDQTACNSANIDFSAGTAEGGVCDNNDEQYTLFHKNDLRNATQLMIARDKDHNLTYEALVRDEWVILESITLKKEWWGKVEFCVAR